jgi:hypothetical protein
MFDLSKTGEVVQERVVLGFDLHIAEAADLDLSCQPRASADRAR